MKRDKVKFEDDGRTIANMNVEGMPWYRAPSKKAEAEHDREPSAGSGHADIPEELTPEGRRAMTGGVMLASLLVGSIYAVVVLLFILFCIFVWFR